MARNAVKPPDLSEIRGGVRNMGTLRYCFFSSVATSFSIFIWCTVAEVLAQLIFIAFRLEINHEKRFADF